MPDDDITEQPDAHEDVPGRDVQDEFADEEYQPRRDGTILLRIDGKRHVLKRPKFKELRAIRERVREMDGELIDDMKPLIEIRETLIPRRPDELPADVEWTPPPFSDEDTARLQEVADTMREVRTASTVRHLTWFRDDVLGKLARPPIRADMDPEDLPEWLVQPQFLGEMAEHWSTVPRRPGVG